ncbi:MAG: Asp23/Gls24 family envelope stress response protein [Adlercreutzia equolifaciens]
MSSTIPGNLHVANDVLADLVGNAAMECYGVVGVCAPNAADSIAKILPASRLRRGVVVSSLEEGVHVDLYIVVEYGTISPRFPQPHRPGQLPEGVRARAAGRVDVHVMDVKVRR